MLYVFLFWKAIIFPSVPLEDFIYDESRLILSVFMKGFLPNQRVDKEFRCTYKHPGFEYYLLVTHDQVIKCVLFCDYGWLMH